MIDQNNKVQNIVLGPKTADELITEIEKFSKENSNQTTEDTKGNGETTGGNTESNDDSAPTVSPVSSVSNVTGLKAVSAAKNVKLTWKKVPDANGYIIYQYNNSKKTWSKKATLNTNTASYTIKGLTPATGYRFAVKAFLNIQSGKQLTSQSYASLYTATAPSAVSFKVTSGKRKATIKWKKVKGATGYTVYYKTTAKGSWRKLKNTKSTNFTKKKLKSGKTYYFTVKAYKTYQKKTYTSSFRSRKIVVR